MRESLIPFFEPSSVAIIGASNNPGKLSNGIVKNLLSYGYEGKVYPINPKENEILARLELSRKCRIYANGAKKRSRHSEAENYFNIAKKYLPPSLAHVKI